MSIWDDNIKIDMKETSFVLDLILYYNTGQSGNFVNVNDIILNRNNKYLQKFSNCIFLRTDHIHDFYLSVSSKFSKLPKS